MLTLVLIFAGLMYIAIAAAVYALLYVMSIDPFDEVIHADPSLWSHVACIFIAAFWPIFIIAILIAAVIIVIANAWQSCKQYKPLEEYDNPIAALQEPKDIDYK